MLKSLKNPVTLATDILHNIEVNGKDITSHVNDAIDDWLNTHFFNLGLDLGAAVAETTLGK